MNAQPGQDVANLCWTVNQPGNKLPCHFKMNSLTIAFISAGCIFGGVLLGMLLRSRLPDHHLSSDSKDTVKLGAGMIATLSALILGLLVSSAKGTFDTMNAEITLGASKIVLLDRVLANYGPVSRDAREQLRRSVAAGHRSGLAGKKDRRDRTDDL